MNCWFCNEPAKIEFAGVHVCAECAEKLFDPGVGSGSVASKPILSLEAKPIKIYLKKLIPYIDMSRSICPYCGAPEFNRDDEVGWVRWECNSWQYFKDGKPASQHPNCMERLERMQAAIASNIDKN